MGERRNRTAEVRGSNPLGSTSLRSLRELWLGSSRRWSQRPRRAAASVHSECPPAIMPWNVCSGLGPQHHVRDPMRLIHRRQAARNETHATDHHCAGIPGVVARMRCRPGVGGRALRRRFRHVARRHQAGSGRAGHLAADDPIGAGRSYIRSGHHLARSCPGRLPAELRAIFRPHGAAAAGEGLEAPEAICADLRRGSSSSTACRAR